MTRERAFQLAALLDELYADPLVQASPLSRDSVAWVRGLALAKIAMPDEEHSVKAPPAERLRLVL